jgi:hypothetical protein
VGFAPASHYVNETSKHTSMRKKKNDHPPVETNAAFRKESRKTDAVPKPALEVNTWV